jgi:hypothetical protein
MTDDEIDTWTRWAAPNVVILVDQHARLTCDVWRKALRHPGVLAELLQDCAAFIDPEPAARAAARAAIELAVIRHVHPQPLNPVLRPGCAWRG